jgi:hypothetical protein
MWVWEVGMAQRVCPACLGPLGWTLTVRGNNEDERPSCPTHGRLKQWVVLTDRGRKVAVVQAEGYGCEPCETAT